MEQTSADPAADARWDAARAAAASPRYADPGDRAILPLWIALGVIVLVAVAGVAAAIVAPLDPGSPGFDLRFGARLIAAAVVGVIGVLTFIVGTIWAAATRHLVWKRTSVSAPLLPAEQTWLRRVVLRGESVDDRYAGVAVAFAREYRRTALGISWMMLGVPIIMLTLAAIGGTVVVALISAGAVLLFVALVVWLASGFPRAGRFITRHPGA